MLENGAFEKVFRFLFPLPQKNAETPLRSLEIPNYELNT